MTDIKLYHGDCLNLMQQIPDGSIDAIIADPPYGTTACSWDSIIPFDLMWQQLNRIIKQSGAIVLFGSQPFTSKLICSNIEMFKYELIWEKSRASNFVHCKHQPLKAHENLIIFSKSASASNSKMSMQYFPQMIAGLPYDKGIPMSKISHMAGGFTKHHSIVRKNETGDRYPRSVRYFRSADGEGGFHPTQKPVALMEYLIKTYTNEGETVLDFTMGSGTTGVACINTSRNFIGIEQDKNYFDIASNRIAERQQEKLSELDC